MKWRFLLIIAFLLGHIHYGLSQGEAEIPASSSSLKFIPNQGQIADINYQSRPDVLFQVEGRGVYLRNNGISYVFSNGAEVSHEIHEAWEELEEEGQQTNAESEEEWYAAMYQKYPIKRQQFNMSFANAKSKIEVTQQDESRDYLNYYLPQCPSGALEIHTYNRVLYQNIYAGIHAQFYGSDAGFKYDIIVEPNANPNQIKLEWTGADSVYVDQNGTLILQSDFYTMTESLPLVYQDLETGRSIVAATYRVQKKRGNKYVVQFEFGNYDKSYPLVIDPWVTNYGGEGGDYIKDVSTDEDGNTYIIGSTQSTINISFEGYQEEFGFAQDAFIVKFNDLGERIWGTYYGGSGSDNGNGLSVNSMGEVFAVGITTSSTVIASDGAYDTDFSGVNDAFLVKFNESGMRLWGTYYGGDDLDRGFGVAIDDLGNVFLSGTTRSLENIATDGAHQAEFGGTGDLALAVAGDAFLVKFDGDGNRLWGTYYGGAEEDQGGKTEVDRDGNVYLCGNTISEESIAFDGFQNSFAGGEFPFFTLNGDAFLVKFTPDGVREWGTYYGGELGEEGKDVATDAFNNVYLTGWTTSVDSVLSHDGYLEFNAGGRDAYLVKFDPTGERLWATYYGGSVGDYAISVWVDEETNNPMITGDTYSLDLPTSSCALQQELIGSENAFIAQFNPSGEIYCASYFGAEHEEDNIIASHGCYIYIAGSTPTDVSTPGAHQETFGGIYDGYLAQIYIQSCGLDVPEITTDISVSDVSSCIDCTGEVTVIIDFVFCDGTPSQFDYIWSTGFEELNTADTTSTISNLCPGDYWLKINQDCTSKDTLFFSIGNDFIIPEIAFSYEAGCVNKPINFINESTTEEGENIAWGWSFGDGETSSDENPIHTYSTVGTYTITLWVENDLGCVDTLIQIIEIFPNHETSVSHTICADSLFQFPDGTVVLINENTYQESNLTSVTGCDSLVKTNIYVIATGSVRDTVFVEFGNTTNLLNGDAITLQENWQDTAVVITENGCDSTHIRTYIIGSFSFLPPNIFSPDADNVNNTFFFPQKHILSFECTVVNRWGVKVFTFNSILDEWNGTNQKTNEPCTDGTYFYTYQGVTVFNTTFEGQGTVQLVRK